MTVQDGKESFQDSTVKTGKGQHLNPGFLAFKAMLFLLYHPVLLLRGFYSP